MAINFRALASAWIGGASLGTCGAGGYLIYDSKNPTGSQWLLDSGYIFNPPKLTSHKSEDNSCFENLFKDDPGFKPNRTYGCRVAELNIWNSGEQFKDKQAVVDYLTFTKKLTVRKGDEGVQSIRVINTREGLIVRAQLIYYKRSDKGWTKEKTEIGTQKLFENGKPKTNEHRTIKEMLEENKRLHFGANGKLWYDRESYSALDKASLINHQNKVEALYEAWKDYKSGSWIWIEDNVSKNIIWDGLSYAFKDSPELKWENAQKVELIATWYHEKFNSMQSRGKWIDAEEFCKHGQKRNISKNDLENLRLFCAKPKS